MGASVLSISDAALLRLDIRVEDADWAGFDRLEVWRSVMGSGGPYEELSGPSWVGAILPDDLVAPGSSRGAYVNIVGKSLNLMLNESIPINVMFTSVNNQTFPRLADAADQITAQGQGYLLAWVDEHGKLGIVTYPAGGNILLQVVGGDAAPVLGLQVGQMGFGKDPRPVLISGKSIYAFLDYWKASSYFYKTRFSHSLTGVVSDFSSPISASARLAVDPSKVTIGWMKLTQSDGRAATEQEVTVFSSYQAMLMDDGSAVVGAPQKFLTDREGYCEFTLLRGMIFDIGIGGSPVTRRVTVPTDPTVLRFNVLDPAYGQDDNFTVQRADLPFATRTTL